MALPVHHAAHLRGRRLGASVPCIMSRTLTLSLPSPAACTRAVLLVFTLLLPVLYDLTVPEVAGDSALLVDPLDTAAIAAGLARLVTDPELRNSLRTAGFANAAQFSWDRCARETLSVLERVSAA